MDVFKVDKDNNYDALDGSTITGYTDLIWTERFQEAGDFEMTASDIQGILNKLTVGDLITHRETAEVMLVESLDISPDSDAGEKLVVKGRTISEVAMENRNYGLETSAGGQHYSRYWGHPGFFWYVWDNVTMWISDRCVFIPQADHFLADPTDYSGTETRSKLEEMGCYVSFTLTDYLPFPHDTVPVQPPKAGVLWDSVKDYLASQKWGVRFLRPNGTDRRTNPYPTYIQDFSEWRTDASQGFYDWDPAFFPSGSIDVYNGLDRSDTVVFSAKAGDLVDPAYLSKIDDYRNVGYIYAAPITGMNWSTPSQVTIYAPGVDPAIAGIDRRVLFIDLTDFWDGEGPTPDAAQYKAEAALQLAAHNLVTYVNGEVSPLSGNKYGVDYFLGDQVSILGNYGLSAKMYVTEVIRTENQEGEKVYPGLAATLATEGD